MKIAGILLFSGQLVALALIALRSELLSPERLGGRSRLPGLGASLTAVGAGVVFIVLLVPRLIRGVARVGVLPLIGSLVGVRRYEDAFEDAWDEALGIGAEDERVDSGAERVAGGRAQIVTVGRAQDERSHESSTSARRTREPSSHLAPSR